MLKLMPRIPTIPMLIMTSMALTFLCGCPPTSIVRSSPSTSEKQTSCDFISDEQDLAECAYRAKTKNDANAAFNIAKLHDEFDHFGTYRSFIKKDNTTAFYWYKIAADLGHNKSLQTVYLNYYLGRYTPKNDIEAERYLNQSAKLGHEWAMLLLGERSEKRNPEKAMDLYLALGLNNNCHAQKKLAEIYLKGELVPQDLCKSYFWGLLANVGWPSRHSDSLSSNTCLSVSNYKVEGELGSKYVQIVQDATSKWKNGQAEPNFPIVQTARTEKPTVSKIRPPEYRDLSKPTSKEKLIKWAAIQIDINRQLTSNLTPSEVFNLVSPSVWTVIAASSAANLKAMNDISLGSAVAISENKLLTNYHLIEDRPFVVVKYGERFESATIISGDKQTDRCILNVANVTLKTAEGIRKYNSLLIGETVYSIGSPKGLENTLGQGIISGKREFGKVNLIQTTAQISKGSSGGGLFDRFGNLIGITTFKVVDSEGLNFAVPIEDFTK